MSIATRQSNISTRDAGWNECTDSPMEHACHVAYILQKGRVASRRVHAFTERSMTPTIQHRVTQTQRGHFRGKGRTEKQRCFRHDVTQDIFNVCNWSVWDESLNWAQANIRGKSLLQVKMGAIVLKQWVSKCRNESDLIMPSSGAFWSLQKGRGRGVKSPQLPNPSIKGMLYYSIVCVCVCVCVRETVGIYGETKMSTTAWMDELCPCWQDSCRAMTKTN